MATLNARHAYPCTVLRHLAAMCARIAQVSGAALSVMTSDGQYGVVCATTPLSVRLAQLQEDLGEGPDHRTTVQNRPVLVPDLTALAGAVHPVWPFFAPAALGAGARAMFVFPIGVGGGVRPCLLTLHRTQGGALPARQADGAVALATTGVALVLQREWNQGNHNFEGLFGPHSGFQPHLHHAVGVTMSQLHLTAADALARIRAYAFTQDRSIIEVADDINAGALKLAPN